MNESTLKSKLMKEIKNQLLSYVAIRHEDVRIAGIPDLSLTGYNRTSWWEFKLSDPDFSSTGIQELTMLRLSAAGYARYVIWFEDKNGSNKVTYIVHPKYIKEFQETRKAEVWCIGYDMRFIVDFMRRVHQP